MARTALITGASRGIGHAIAGQLASDGVSVLTPARSDLDLASNTSIDRFLASLDAPVDILVNNAGINVLSGIADIRDEDLGDMFQINLVGPLRLMRGIVPRMIKKEYGRIINISSIWSFVSKQRRIAYSSAKAGLNGLTRAAAVELAQHNILVNAIAPGFVNTELTRRNNPDEELRRIADSIPLGRLAEPSEIAHLASFLCSERNSYITGQTIIIDGGFTCT